VSFFEARGDRSPSLVSGNQPGAGRAGVIAMGIATRFVRRVALVSDDDILRARQLLWEECRVITEPGAAATLAVLLSGAYASESGERIGLVLCGGNTDPADLSDGARGP